MALPMVFGAVIGGILFFSIEGTTGAILGIFALILGNVGGVLFSRKIADND